MTTDEDLARVAYDKFGMPGQKPWAELVDSVQASFVRPAAAVRAHVTAWMFDGAGAPEPTVGELGQIAYEANDPGPLGAPWEHLTPIRKGQWAAFGRSIFDQLMAELPHDEDKTPVPEGPPTQPQGSMSLLGLGRKA